MKPIAKLIQLALIFSIFGGASTVNAQSLPPDINQNSLEYLKSRIIDLTPPDKGISDNELSLVNERTDINNQIDNLRNWLAKIAFDYTGKIGEVEKAKTNMEAILGNLNKLDCESIGYDFGLERRIRVEIGSIVELSHSMGLGSTWLDAPLQDTGFFRSSGRTENLSGKDRCLEWKKFVGDQSKQQELFQFFEQIKSELVTRRQLAAEVKSQASLLQDLLHKRKDIIQKKLETKTAKGTLADKLWIALLVIGTFSLGTILAVRLFSSEIQIEWVASGQVIQFVTVMILLSVVMALGLAGILQENTLGTLLGGIAGYVLAQGVGRAAAREVTRGLDSPPAGRDSALINRTHQN